MFNGNHSKMNYTDSVRDLMIYVQNTLKQMTGAGPAAKMLEELHPGRPPTPSGALPSPPWETARRTDRGLRALRVARPPGGPGLPGPREGRRGTCRSHLS